MNAGDLRTRVRLERPERAPDDIGGGALTWVDMGDAWAKIVSRAGGEGALYDGASARTSHALDIRMRRDVAPGWRVILGARVLRVIGIADADSHGALLRLSCEEEIA